MSFLFVLYALFIAQKRESEECKQIHNKIDGVISTLELNVGFPKSGFKQKIINGSTRKNE